MTESEYMDAANMARLRCALRVLSEFCHRAVYDEKCRIEAKVTTAFRNLDDAARELSARIGDLEESE